MPLTDFQLRRQTQLWVSYCCWTVCCKAFCLSIIICDRLLSSPHFQDTVYLFTSAITVVLESDYTALVATEQPSEIRALARIRADSLLTLTPFGWYSDALLSFRRYWDLHAALWDYFPLHPWLCICYPPAIFPLLLVHHKSNFATNKWHNWPSAAYFTYKLTAYSNRYVRLERSCKQLKRKHPNGYISSRHWWLALFCPADISVLCMRIKLVLQQQSGKDKYHFLLILE